MHSTKWGCGFWWSEYIQPQYRYTYRHTYTLCMKTYTVGDVWDGCVRRNHKNTMRKLSLVLLPAAQSSFQYWPRFSQRQCVRLRLTLTVSTLFTWILFENVPWSECVQCPCIQIGCRKWGDAKVVYSFISFILLLLLLFFIYCSPQQTIHKCEFRITHLALLFAENHSSLMSDTK